MNGGLDALQQRRIVYDGFPQLAPVDALGANCTGHKGTDRFGPGRSGPIKTVDCGVGVPNRHARGSKERKGRGFSHAD
jgi:hypothetical protein